MHWTARIKAHEFHRLNKESNIFGSTISWNQNICGNNFCNIDRFWWKLPKISINSMYKSLTRIFNVAILCLSACPSLILIWYSFSGFCKRYTESECCKSNDLDWSFSKSLQFWGLFLPTAYFLYWNDWKSLFTVSYIYLWTLHSIIGNKADCPDRQVKREDGERLAREYNVTFMETSAKTGLNVDLAFLAVAR